MFFTLLLLLSGLTLSAVAIYYSVIGLTAIFAAAFWPIVIMGTSLEVSKLVAASWLKANWSRIPIIMKAYMTTAVAVLMIITSMGIFGFLSKAHSDNSLVSGEVQSKIALYDEKIKTARENIDANRKALKQMDEAVDQVMARSSSETGADRAVALRRSQFRERARLQSEIQAEQKTISSLSQERAPIAAEVRKVEAEVGPIKYIAAFIYGDNPDANILEKAVTWVIIIIVSVFDPLAVIMLLAAQMSFHWYREQKKLESETATPVYIEDVEEKPTADNPLPENNNIDDKDIVEEQALDDIKVEPVIVNPELIEENVKSSYNIEKIPAEFDVDNLPNTKLDSHVDINFPKNPFIGQQHRALNEEGGKDYVYNGVDWVFTPLNGNSSEYVQNGEQNTSTIWQKLIKKTDD
jgi:hypothetical protein